MDAGGQGEGPVKGQELFVQFASGAVDPQRRFQKKQFPFADNMRNFVVIVWFAQKTVADSRQLDGCFILACSFSKAKRETKKLIRRMSSGQCGEL